MGLLPLAPAKGLHSGSFRRPRTQILRAPFLSGRLYSTERALWKLNWFLRDFGYDMDLLTQDQMDEKALINLRGVVRTTYKTLNGHTFQNLEAFAPEADWAELSLAEASVVQIQEQP